MLKRIVILLIVISSVVANACDINNKINKIIPALVKVESSGNIKAVGDQGRAKGKLQLHKIYIDDVNRLFGTKYKHDDAFDPVKAEEIVRLYLSHYGKLYEKKTGKTISFEILARMHNGGGNNYRAKATAKYWAKVSKVLNS